MHIQTLTKSPTQAGQKLNRSFSDVSPIRRSQLNSNNISPIRSQFEETKNEQPNM